MVSRAGEAGAADAAAALLAALEGEWRLVREIDDRMAGASGRFEGTADFAPGAGGLRYAEAGELRLAGQPPLRAERRYLWRAASGRVAVFFADGRPFHEFDGGAARPRAVHACAADLYRVVYDFSGWPLWEAAWHVRGPRKAYRVVSRYARTA